MNGKEIATFYFSSERKEKRGKRKKMEIEERVGTR